MEGTSDNVTATLPDDATSDELRSGLLAVGVISFLLFLALCALIWFLLRRITRLGRRITCLRSRLTDLENKLLVRDVKSERRGHIYGSNYNSAGSCELGLQSGSERERQSDRRPVRIWGNIPRGPDYLSESGTGGDLQSGSERNLRSGSERDLRSGSERDRQSGSKPVRIWGKIPRGPDYLSESGSERDPQSGSERHLRSGSERDLRSGRERDRQSGSKPVRIWGKIPRGPDYLSESGTERDLQSGSERNLRSGSKPVRIWGKIPSGPDYLSESGTERDLQSGSERNLRSGSERDLRSGNERDRQSGSKPIRIWGKIPRGPDYLSESGTERDLQSGSERNLPSGSERDLRSGNERDLQSGSKPVRIWGKSFTRGKDYLSESGSERDPQSGSERHLRSGSERDLRSGSERDRQSGSKPVRIWGKIPRGPDYLSESGTERDLQSGSERNLRSGSERDLRSGSERDLQSGSKPVRIWGKSFTRGKDYLSESGSERDPQSGSERHLRSGSERDLQSGCERDLQSHSQQTHVQIWGKKATIVGSPRILSQAYATTQDYFSLEGQLWKPNRLKIKAANVIIRSNRFQNELPDGKLSTESSSASKRPTSAINLAAISGVDGAAANVPYVSQKELFKHETIGPEGGCIEVSGVTLTVPLGAVETYLSLSIGVTWDTDKYPSLPKEQALLCPVVICEPQGIVFKQPVELCFPHCAKDIMKDWTPRLLYSQTQINAAAVWQTMDLGHHTERDLSNGRVKLKIKHFTLYTMAGESQPGKTAAKDVKMLAFAPPLKLGKMHKVRIYCVENYKNEIGGIREDEYDMQGKLVHQRMPLFLHDNGNNLLVENSKLSDGWKLDGPRLVELSFESIWHGRTPSCTFKFDSVKRVRKFIADFAAYQKDRESDRQELHIAEEAEETEADPMNVSTGLIPIELRRRLVVLLQPEVMSGNDWRMFAEMLGMDGADIAFLERQKSIVEILLNRWENHNTDLQTLRQLMVDIERVDAASEVAKHCSASSNR